MLNGNSYFPIPKAKSFWVLFFILLSPFFSLSASSQTLEKSIKVNLFGGTNAYTNTEWNNWDSRNPSLNSPVFKYTDGTSSGVYAKISASDNFGDNGTTYGGTMCPPQVLRYASFASGTRTLTINNLNANSVFNLQLFASRMRTDGQKTIFTIGTTPITISTDYNLNNAAVFNNIKPNSNGQIIVSISKPSNLSFNYLNGFTITTSSATANSFPVVNAGPNQNIYLPANSMQLIGSAYDVDGSITSYEWTKISGPNSIITNPGNPITEITNLELGSYTFRLTATDDQGARNYSDATVTVTNGPPPLINAGSDIVLNLPQNSVIVRGQATSTAGIISLNWRQLSGPTTTIIQNSNANETLISGFTEGTFKFIFSATDSKSITAQDTISVFVNAQGFEPPSIVDSLNCNVTVKVVVLGSSTASGTGASPFDSAWVNKLRRYLIGKNPNNQVINLGLATYTTYHVLCPTGFVPPLNRPSPEENNNISAALRLNPTFIIINLPSNDAANGYSLQEQKDNYERTMALTTARNIPVWVSTSQPRNLTTTQKNQLKSLKEWTETRFGRFSVDFWTTLATADGSINPVYDFGDGIHLNNKGHHILYQRIVEEQLLDYFCAQSDITPPTVNAGQDQTIELPINSVTLNGIAQDISGIKSISWSQISGPAIATITSPNSNQTIVSGLIEGGYTFQYKATDNFNLVSTDEISIIVRPATLNIPPVASAGPDQIFRLPINSTIVTGNASDQDGTISYINWTKISGGSATIQSPNSLSTSITNLTNGTYIFRLTIRDNLGSTNSDDISITVQPLLLNTVSAGQDQNIQLPLNYTILTGINGDEYGTKSILWSQTSGPSIVNIISPTELNTRIENLIAGIYNFSLTIKNLEENDISDIITVNVAPIPSPNRTIQVNLFKGLNPYSNSQWNNWNVTNISINSPLFNYTDGSNSGVFARITASDNVGDNGTTYGGNMCPSGVLRHASFASGTRTLTLNTLNTNRTYSLELYGSRLRTDGQKTIFTIGSQQITISTDNNLSNAASFSGIRPNTNGQIIVTISKPSTLSFNYLNGFKITEEEISSNSVLFNNQLAFVDQELKNEGITLKKNINVFPNPFTGYINIEVFSGKITSVTVLSAIGQSIKEINSINSMNTEIDLSKLHSGVYIILIKTDTNFYIKKIIKN